MGSSLATKMVHRTDMVMVIRRIRVTIRCCLRNDLELLFGLLLGELLDNDVILDKSMASLLFNKLSLSREL